MPVKGVDATLDSPGAITAGTEAFAGGGSPVPNRMVFRAAALTGLTAALRATTRSVQLAGSVTGG